MQEMQFDLRPQRKHCQITRTVGPEQPELNILNEIRTNARKFLCDF